MAFAKFEENRFRIDGEIAENHAILVNLTASIVWSMVIYSNTIAPLDMKGCICHFVKWQNQADTSFHIK